MAGYTRQSAATIVTGAEILASIFNAEFNQLQAAFNGTTGHDHSGGTGQGPKLALTGAVSGILPVTNGGTGVATHTAGILIGNGTSAIITRVLTGTSNEITVTNGSGVSAAPTISIPTAVTFTGKTITGGTYASPTMSGTLTASGTVTVSGTFNGGTYTGAAFNGTVGATTPSTGAFTIITGTSSLTLTDPDAGAGIGPIIELYRNSATPAPGDALSTIDWTANSSTAVKRTVGRIVVQLDDATNASEDTTMFLRNIVAGTLTTQITLSATGAQIGAIGATTPGTGAFSTLTASGAFTSLGIDDNATGDALEITNTSIRSKVNDQLALGDTTHMWSDLFIASGGVININNGNWVATHTSGILTVGTGDLRVTTAGTNSASVVTVGGTQTLTSKTLTGAALNGTIGATTPSTGAFTTLSSSGAANLNSLTGAGKPPTRQIFTANGTYTAPAGLTKAVVHCIGGGGGGGYARSNAAQASGGTGGGAGGYSASLLTAATIGASQTVTIGAGGAGGIGSTPVSAVAGGDTSFGVLVVAKGGAAGGNVASTATTDIGQGAAGGAAASGTGDVKASGGSGTMCVILAPTFHAPGNGGDSALGGGGLGVIGGTGGAGSVGGGGGGVSGGSSNQRTGGAGGDGIVIVDEYY